MNSIGVLARTLEMSILRMGPPPQLFALVELIRLNTYRQLSLAL